MIYISLILFLFLLFNFSPDYSYVSAAFFLSRSSLPSLWREKCIYIHKSFTFILVTLNCICFTSVDERVSALVRKAPNF